MTTFSKTAIWLTTERMCRSKQHFFQVKSRTYWGYVSDSEKDEVGGFRERSGYKKTSRMSLLLPWFCLRGTTFTYRPSGTRYSIPEYDFRTLSYPQTIFRRLVVLLSIDCISFFLKILAFPTENIYANAGVSWIAIEASPWSITIGGRTACFARGRPSITCEVLWLRLWPLIFELEFIEY